MSSSFSVFGGGGSNVFTSPDGGVASYDLNLNSSELQNCHLKFSTTGGDFTLNLLSNRDVGYSGYIAVTTVSDITVTFNFLKGDTTSSTQNSLNILTNLDGLNKAVLKKTTQTSDVTFLFKYYVVSPGLVIMWNLSDVPDANVDVTATEPQTIAADDTYDNVQVFSSDSEVTIPEGINTFTAYVWGGGGTADGIITSGAFCQSTITLPQTSDGTKKIVVGVGAAQTESTPGGSSFLAVGGKTLVIAGAGANTDTPGYGLGFVNDEAGLLVSQVYNEPVLKTLAGPEGEEETEGTVINTGIKGNDGRQISYIGSNIEIYKANPAYVPPEDPDTEEVQPTGLYITNYGSESSFSDKDDRFDPYSNVVYKNTKCITQFGTAGVTSYHHNAQSQLNNSGVLYGLGNQAGLVVIRFERPQSVNGISSLAEQDGQLTVAFESDKDTNSTHWVLYQKLNGKVTKSGVYPVSQTTVAITVEPDIKYTWYAYACDEDSTVKYGSMHTVSVGEYPVTVSRDVTYIEETNEVEITNINTESSVALVDADETKTTFGRSYLFEVDQDPFYIFINSGIYDIYYFDASSNINYYRLDTSVDPFADLTDNYVFRVRSNGGGDITISEIIANNNIQIAGEFSEITETGQNLLTPESMIASFLTDSDLDSTITWTVSGADYATGDSKYIGSDIIEISVPKSPVVKSFTV